MHYIYLYQNKINLKIYIGQTKYLDKRHKRHLSQARKDKPDLVFECAIKKYGSDSFTFCILEQVPTQEEANDAEEFWVQYFESQIEKGKGYNVAPGGWLASYGMRGKKHTNETKKKMSDAASGKKNHNYGLKLSDTIRKNMSSARKRDKIFVGEKNYSAKLTRQQVTSIRQEYSSGDIYQRVLGEKYGVDQSVISDIVNNRIWK